jgi:hypothetical protein
MMDKLTEIPPGKTLFAQLKEKHWQPITIVKNSSHCASCAKPFNLLRQPAKEIHSTPDGLRLPILVISLLCRVCTSQYRSGGEGERKVRAAIEECLARDMAP